MQKLKSCEARSKGFKLRMRIFTLKTDKSGLWLKETALNEVLIVFGKGNYGKTRI